MPKCSYCDANAVYYECNGNGHGLLCPAHARLAISAPRSPAPRPPLTIRPATPADRPGIVQLAEYFWGEVDVDCFDRSYRVDELPAYVAYDGDEITGVASYAHEGDTVNLVMLDVMPRWQHRGVGRALIDALSGFARAEGVGRIIVATTNDALPALALYQRLGFVITEVLVGKLVEHHGGVELGFSRIPVRDEIRLELLL